MIKVSRAKSDDVGKRNTEYSRHGFFKTDSQSPGTELIIQKPHPGFPRGTGSSLTLALPNLPLDMNTELKSPSEKVWGLAGSAQALGMEITSDLAASVFGC